MAEASEQPMSVDRSAAKAAFLASSQVVRQVIGANPSPHGIGSAA